MDLKTGIKHILDGNAVIIMGAGASYGAKNTTDNAFPSGCLLAKGLYEKCKIKPDNINDLGDASRVYIKEHSKSDLISEIKRQLDCAYVTESHKTIYSLPWMRYYTTNYDNVAIIAAHATGKTLFPVTLSSDSKQYFDRSNICVFLNGHIDNLNEKTLEEEFKLTTRSYYENILNNPWCECLRQDLDAAKSIFIVGLSLNYDLDLSRILYNDDYKKKTIIITKPDATENEIDRLQEFGEVNTIGIDRFSDEIKIIQTVYYPRSITPDERLYECFVHDYKKKYPLSSAQPDSVFDLIRYGQIEDNLFAKKTSKKGKKRFSGIVNRSMVSKIKQDIIDKKKVVFLCSELGNGKTTCLSIICYALSTEDIHIFTLVNSDSPKIAEEIAAIRELANQTAVLVVIDDYAHYYEVVRRFSNAYRGNIQFLLSARTALNDSNMPGVISDFGLAPGESAVYDINYLDDNEISECISLFDRFGLFGEYAGLKPHEKFLRLTAHKAGAKKFQNIVLDLFNSKAKVITEKLEEIVLTISKDSDQFSTAVLLLLLRNVMNLRLSVRDIECISQINISTDASFKTNAAISELLTYNNGGNIKIKSPVTAKYILQRISNPESIILALVKVAEYSEKYSALDKFKTLLKSITSYSLIASFVKGFKDYDAFMLRYYDELSKITYYTENNFFWLQYAMVCIEMRKFDRAEQYLNVALSKSGESFVPFQINNQRARLYLIRIINNQSEDPFEDFKSAHNLLMVPIVSVKDDEYNVIWAFRFYYAKEIQEIMQSPDQQETYRNACREALKRTYTYIKGHPDQQQRLEQLTKNLLSASFMK